VTAAGGKAVELFDSVERGERHLAYMASAYLAGRVPELGILDLPFSVSDRNAAMRALDGEAGRLLRQAVADRTGHHVLAFWDNGFRHLSNGVRPLHSPADCAGLVIRTLDSEHYRELLAALGFSPVTVDVRDLVHAVESGAVHAQENPLANLMSFGLWRHHRHVTLSSHLFGALLVVCPGHWFRQLLPAQRAALQEAVDEATAQQRAMAAAQDVTALASLRMHGVAVLGPGQVDLGAFRAAAEPLALRQRNALPPELIDAYFSETTSIQ
jgi:TRAP-type C4-dicarboxylate transport system substrate-binding protein